MQWSFNLGKIFGIQFRIHITFLLLLLFIFFSSLSKRGPEQAFVAVLFICAVFLCVLIHEVGHSLIAQRFGKKAQSITLLPIGGVATIEELPDKPGQEIAISIIGPFINLAIAGILYLFVGSWKGFGQPNLHPASPSEFFAWLIGVNIMLALFNLIPAFPMDGGRVLRGLLALRISFVRATSVAVFIGQGLAMVFIFYGVFNNFWLALIGIFLYMGAGSEQQHVMVRSILHRVPVSAAMATDLLAVKPDDRLAGVLAQVYQGSQNDFPVIGDSGMQGILTRTGILAAIHEKGTEVPVSEVMDRDYAAFAPETPLDEVYTRLLSGNRSSAAVIEGGQFKGMLFLDSISRYLMVQNAIKGAV